MLDPLDKHYTCLDVFMNVLETVAFTIHLKNVYMMGQTIQQRACKSICTKDFGPFIEGQI